VPLSAGGGHESANLRVLCLSCHGRRSAEQSHGRRDWVRPDGTREARIERPSIGRPMQNLQGQGEGMGRTMQNLQQQVEGPGRGEAPATLA